MLNYFYRKTLLFLILPASIVFANDDDYLWLEDIDGKKSMQWVKKHNQITKEKLTNNKLYSDLFKQALTVLDSKSRLPVVSQNGEWLYNFWQNKEHPRGVYRKTTLKSFNESNPQWQTVLDMDEYSKKHNQNYDFHGMSCLPPEGTDCLVSLSPGGGDAEVIREFDLENHKFIDNGFYVPVAKSQVSWINKDTIYIGTDFGPGSMTESGYPRIIKKWKRGTPLNSAEKIYEGNIKSTSATAFTLGKGNDTIEMISERTSFWSTKKYQVKDDKIMPLTLPETAIVVGLYKKKMVIELKDDWQFKGNNFIQGEILLADIELLRGEKGTIESVIKPKKKAIIENISTTEQGLLITILEDVKARLYRYQKKKNGRWKIKKIPFPDNGSLTVTSVDDNTGNFFVQYESFITPPSLYHVSSKELKPKLLKQQAESFDGSQMKVEQFFATSVDGTSVPYFVVMKKNTQFNGKNPTHIFSYGGFRNSLTPSYSGSYEALSGAYGKLWLERGGVFVLANIRGGGEYGPQWHQAALFKNRHKAYEDFESVAKNLIKRNITSPKHLGIEGRSNGGLLVTATMTRHPELYSAVICGAPLIDMKRYNKLLAGASWVGEYGNPDDPDMWEYIKTYSPYQNVKKDNTYPSILFYTSTRDDRVHPGHARKMAAKMKAFNHRVEYYENIEGGHHGFSTNEQLAHRLALSYTHLWSHLQ